MGQSGGHDRGRSGVRSRRDGSAGPAAAPIVRAIAPVMPALPCAPGRLPCAAEPEAIGRTLLPPGAPSAPDAPPPPPAALVPPARAAVRREADPFVRRLARLD